MIVLKTPEEIAKMRLLGQQLARILHTLKQQAKAGMTTTELDEIASSETELIGARCASYGYGGFPGHCCISLNETVIHGIPSGRELKEGDLVSIDHVIERDGLFVDSTITFTIGLPNRSQTRIMEVCSKALDEGIAIAKPGKKIGDIGNAVQLVVEGAGYSIIRDFVGHGVGKSMHEDPQIPNFGRPGTGPMIVPGMTLAIEPMIAEGSYHVRIAKDGWTTNMADGKLSCHTEHTIAVLENETVVLTKI